MSAHWSDALERLDACDPALAWARTQPTAEAAWLACERADWLVWIAERLGVDLRLVALVGADCARTAWKYVDDGATLTALMLTDHIVREWAEGRADRDDLLAADAAAAAAAYDAADVAADARVAAYAAADAATCAAYAAYGADAARAAYGADYAAAYAGRAAARAAGARAQRDMAQLVRARIPVEAVHAAWEREVRR